MEQTTPGMYDLANDAFDSAIDSLMRERMRMIRRVAFQLHRERVAAARSPRRAARRAHRKALKRRR